MLYEHLTSTVESFGKIYKSSGNASSSIRTSNSFNISLNGCNFRLDDKNSCVLALISFEFIFNEFFSLKFAFCVDMFIFVLFSDVLFSHSLILSMALFPLKFDYHRGLG